VSVALIEGIDPLLDEVALEAARALGFAPATRDGVPLASEVDYRFHFDYALVDQREGASAGSLYGRIEDGAGIPVPGATVVLVPLDPGLGPARTVLAGDDGRFGTGFLPPGRWEVRIGLGSQPPVVFPLDIAAGEVVQSTFPIAASDNEIVVYGQRATWREVARGALVPDSGTVTGSYTLTRRDIEATPGSLEDVARAVQALPGVVGDPDLLAGFNVRGGETSDVVFVLDRVPLDNPFHLAGFNSVFNPDMIREVKFYAGAPPADVPAGTSAVLAVESWDGSPRDDSDGFDGALDLSASSARAFLMGPIDRNERWTVALAARRTYLEGYFQVMKWANLIDTAFAAPEYSELSLRTAYRVAHHRVMLTAMRSGDSLALVDSEDPSTVSFEGSFQLQNSLQLYALDHTWTPSDAVTWRTTLAATLDRSFLERDLGGLTSRTFRTNRGYARTDLSVALGNHRVDLGADGGHSALTAEGEIEDPRGVPSWANTGIADLGGELVALGEIDPWSDASVYGQVTAALPVNLRAGVRGRYAGATGELLWSPSAGASLPLPTGTIPKVAWGLYHRTPREPVVLDPELGNPDIASERAMQVVVGVDQGLPLPGNESGGLLRVEGYWTDRTNLVVHPDVPEAPGLAFDNAGSGRDRGIDALVAARSGRISGMLTYGFLLSDRYNPLNTIFATHVRPPQDQRHTFGASTEVQLSGRWRATARYAFHTGRPVSALVAAGETTAALACLNCERLGPTHDLAVRAEWRRVYERHLLSFYVEVLNAANVRSDFTPITEVEEGVLVPGMLSHLPVRPFLGVRSDF
ncbi:MAG: carboxypeptidase regulatory-like domain-containing protein, partial [Deltaproteobacteria bacterium]|nr:carboxypeptidase regulatory-like domain-containing protein [Deltaproteobacteria bacterium]